MYNIKIALVNTLLLQAQTFMSDQDGKIKEIQHVKQTLKENEYPD